MTLPQIKGFINAIVRRQAVQHATYITNSAIAASGDGKAVKKAVDGYMKERSEASAKKKKAKPQIQLTEEDFLTR